MYFKTIINCKIRLILLTTTGSAFIFLLAFYNSALIDSREKCEQNNEQSTDFVQHSIKGINVSPEELLLGDASIRCFIMEEDFLHALEYKLMTNCGDSNVVEAFKRCKALIKSHHMRNIEFWEYMVLQSPSGDVGKIIKPIYGTYIKYAGIYLFSVIQFTYNSNEPIVTSNGDILRFTVEDQFVKYRLLELIKSLNMAVIVEAHTGANEENPSELARNRAERAIQVLVDIGVNPDNIVGRWWGQDGPIIDYEEIGSRFKSNICQVNIEFEECPDLFPQSVFIYCW